MGEVNGRGHIVHPVSKLHHHHHECAKDFSQDNFQTTFYIPFSFGRIDGPDHILASTLTFNFQD